VRSSPGSDNEMKTKLFWATGESDQVGNAFGYRHHNTMMKKYSEQYFEYTLSAKIAMQIVPMDYFTKIPGKFNIAFSMWEFQDLPPAYIKNMYKADAFIVPSSFCRDLFMRYTDKPVYVCWEGIEPEKYPFHNRVDSYNEVVSKKRRFRFLWVGAPNVRKGYPIVLESTKLFQEIPNTEIYLKTTVPPISYKNMWRSIWRNRKDIFNWDRGKRESYLQAIGRMIQRIPRPQLNDRVFTYGKYKNVIMDTRRLSQQELTELYNSAHCFLLPTLGEGWGLTLCEAMATGCPSIASAVTGCADFFNDDVGYPIQTVQYEQDMTKEYKLKTKAHIPQAKDMCEKMIFVLQNYGKALAKGQKASALVHKKFTWQNSAKRLHEIIKEIEKNVN
jgi:glycosyltransferase involved in cell wall biosynthesis